jgi:hypothetical protein
MIRVGNLKMLNLMDLNDEWKCLSVWKCRLLTHDVEILDLKIFEMNKYKSHYGRKYTITLSNRVKIDGVDEI